MTAGIVLLAFGEPEEPTLDAIVPFLERIFSINASLEEGDEEAQRRRSRELAERRAPGLLEEYEAIGGSPLNRQARARAGALQAELSGRDLAVRTYVGMQFTDPPVSEAVNRAREEGVERLVGLPVYPLCGPSTTVAALRDLSAAVSAAGWEVERADLSGWHRHPDYLALRAGRIAKFAEAEGVDLQDPGTRLVFSAHGTPLKYLREGSRYDRYVTECCRLVADRVGVRDHVVGYQNHANRGVEWTRPDIDDVITALDAERVVVDPISFVHEQSETLAELDIELREEAEEAGLAFHRVPVPHDDPRLVTILADLVEPLVKGEEPEGFALDPCRCHEAPGTVCLNGERRGPGDGIA